MDTVCPSLRGDNPGVLLCELSPVHVDNHQLQQAEFAQYKIFCSKIYDFWQERHLFINSLTTNDENS